VQREDAGALGEHRVRRGEHAALGRRDVLGDVEAVRRRAPAGTQRLAADGGLDAVRGVHHQRDAASHGGRLEPVEVDRVAREVHRDRGAGALAARRRELLDAEAAGDRIDVGEHRHRAGVDRDVGGGGEGQRRHHHLVAGADARAQQAEVERGSRAVDRDGVGRADVLGEAALELLRARAGADPQAAQGVDDRGDVLLAQIGLSEDDEGRGAHGVNATATRAGIGADGSTHPTGPVASWGGV
jgi:hypothetical protein